MNKQREFLFPYPVPEDYPLLAPLLVKPLGLVLQPEAIVDFANFLEMAGVKLHDIAPAVHTFDIGWDDDHEIDFTPPNGHLTCVWSPDLPSALAIDKNTGRVHGVLPSGPWKFSIHVGPQIKYDALGGSGSPHDDGQWIGALEDREPVDESLGVDVAALSPAQRARLRAELDKEEA